MKLREGKCIISLFIALLCFFSVGSDAYAQTGNNPQPSSSTFGNLEVGLPGNGIFGKGKSIDSFISAAQKKPILTLVNLTVTFLTAILVIVSVITIVVGGYLYMTAAGSGSQLEKAKEMITAALIGIFIAFISVVLLNTINPALGPEAKEPKLAPSGSSGSSEGSDLDPNAF